MNRAKRSRKKPQSKTERSTESLIRSLLDNRITETRVRELFYWSQEPGLLEVIRGIVTMEEKARGALETFIALTSEPKSIVAMLDASGVLRLSSAEVARTAALAHGAAEDESPRVLN